ncbi:molybdenum ABC transporter ATP-binding protein [Phytohalomonas tamaricis]|uniref:molybdenum ABC transporter ATP-binding protein n=1 Tax=Phytohalomonas tamaricis TaxID=2081032 RepID=UPI000D0BE745|nr:molybdenum ABC transporter ATP-binding protein [Phytohalomonas tamaricis]
MLELNVTKQLGDFTLDANLKAPAQGVTALFGQSGSGKTSLLRMLAGLDRPEHGLICIDDTVFVDTERRLFIPPHKRRLGVVFQEALLFPHYSVRGNLEYGMAVGAKAEFDMLVELLGIEHLLGRMPGVLSGGEARRVAIGRALLTKPRMLLMDEPLTGLDGARKQELLSYIMRLTHEVDIPVLFVSHDTQEVMAIADRLALVEKGRVVASGELGAMLTQSELSAQLGGFAATSLLKARWTAHDDMTGLSWFELDDGQRLALSRVECVADDILHIQVNVHDVALALSRPTGTSFINMLDAEIEALTEGQQGGVELTLRLGDQCLRAQVTPYVADALGLREGLPVIALIRSASLARQRRSRAS